MPGRAPLFLTNVTFEPGCRNNGHVHHATKAGGQILICTAGEGWYQEGGKEADFFPDEHPISKLIKIDVPANLRASGASTVTNGTYNS